MILRISDGLSGKFAHHVAGFRRSSGRYPQKRFAKRLFRSKAFQSHSGSFLRNSSRFQKRTDGGFVDTGRNREYGSFGSFPGTDTERTIEFRVSSLFRINRNERHRMFPIISVRNSPELFQFGKLGDGHCPGTDVFRNGFQRERKVARIAVFRRSEPPEKIHSVFKESDFVPQFEGFRSKSLETFIGSIGPTAEPNVFSVFLFLGNSSHPHGGGGDEPRMVFRIEPNQAGYRDDRFALFVEIRIRNVPAHRKRVGFPIRKAGYRRIRKCNGGYRERFRQRSDAGSFLERFGDFFPNAFRNGSRISGQIGR